MYCFISRDAVSFDVVGLSHKVVVWHKDGRVDVQKPVVFMTRCSGWFVAVICIPHYLSRSVLEQDACPFPFLGPPYGANRPRIQFPLRKHSVDGV
jgi:hypothetical protein